MQAATRNVRFRRIRTGITISLFVTTLSACQMLPEQPNLTQCDCPPTEKACPSITVTSKPQRLVPTTATLPLKEPEPLLRPTPPPKPSPKKISKPVAKKPIAPATVDEKPVIGRVEYIVIKPENFKVKARIDTGAGISSLTAFNLVRFERDGKPWVRFTVPETRKNDAVVYEKPVKRFVEIKQLGGKYQKRPVIELTLALGSIKEQVDVTLTDRTGYVYQMLIGRNFLRDRAIVDVSRKFSIKTI